MASAKSPGASVLVSLPPAARPTGPSTHELAVEVFERGFRALQERSYGQAAGLFTSIICIEDFTVRTLLDERGELSTLYAEAEITRNEALTDYSVEFALYGAVTGSSNMDCPSAS